MSNFKKIVVAVTGASGSVYAKLLLDKLLLLQAETSEISLIFSANAIDIWKHEIGDESYKNYPFKQFQKDDFTAPFASGSSDYGTMIICPCSMGVVGRIASGVSNDLVSRAADVMLKERRKLIMVVRETPYSLIHINTMKLVTEAGGIICPATPSFYQKPTTIEDVCGTVVDRIIDLSGLNQDTFRWGKQKK